jgi:DHA2 family multidrug resistance protein
MTTTVSAAAGDTALHRAFILTTLTFVTMLYAMTVTIANVSLPQMQGALSATQDQIAWVVTFNIVATAVATPMAGWLATRLGRRRLLVYAVVGFAIASLLCGLATSVEELVLYRIAQGACGAPLVPLSQAIVVDTYPKRQHGPATAIWGVGVILGPIIAPALGGYLSEAYSWRWVFFMIVPFALVSLVAVLAFIRDRTEARRVALDWTGFLALALAIAAFQLMLDRGERNDWFQSGETLLEAGLALAGLYVFVVHTLTARNPFLNPRLLHDRNFTIGIIIVLLFGMLNFTPITLLPTLLQDLQGYPDSIIGLVLSARGVGTFAGFVFMIFASRLDPRIPMATGFLLQAYAGWVMVGFDINVPLWSVLWTAAVQGLGVGLIWVPLSVVTFSTLAPAHVPEGTAIFHLLRNIGSSIHISLSITLVIRATKLNYAAMVEFISPYNETFDLPWARGAWGTGSLEQLKALSTETQRQATMIGYLDAFYLFAVTAALAVPLVFLIRWRPTPTPIVQGKAAP